MNIPLKVVINVHPNNLYSLTVWFRKSNGDIGVIQSVKVAKEQVPAKLDNFVNQLDLSNYPFDNPASRNALGSF